MSSDHHVGQRISFDGALCTVRYIGEVTGTTGQWLGVEWDDISRGKHNGSHRGVRYFTCLSSSAHSASFVRPSRPAEKPNTLLQALREKYAPDQHKNQQQDGSQSHDDPIVISGKVAEEMGFDKIRRQQADLQELRVVILDGLRIATAQSRQEADEEPLGRVCRKVTKLDLGRNLFETMRPVVDICGALPTLQSLTLSGNRFASVREEESPTASSEPFGGIAELVLDDLLLEWQDLCHIACRCPKLATLSAGMNLLSSLPILDYGTLRTSLTSLYLEYNEITWLSDLASLTQLENLRNLHLKGNRIQGHVPSGSTTTADFSSPFTFPKSLQYLDVSYNDVAAWCFVDDLPLHFPGLTALRLAHNPVYEAHAEGDSSASSSEEAHMITIARLASLKSLNFTAIKANDRSNAEMFYLSRIAKQLAGVPGTAESTVLEEHPRYAQLCEIYGAPDVIRREEVNPSFLEARLVAVTFRLDAEGVTKTVQIPRSFDIYAVKGIAGRALGLKPTQLNLVWETGEWDPVAGYDTNKDADSSDEEDEMLDLGAAHDGDADTTGFTEGPVQSVMTSNKEAIAATTGVDTSDGAALERGEREDTSPQGGRWVKRQVELRDSPRQLGYCVDGLAVTIRVEQVR